MLRGIFKNISMKIVRIIQLSFSLFFLISTYMISQDTLYVSDHGYSIDHQKKLIIINERADDVYTASGVWLSDYYELTQEVDTLQIGQGYSVVNSNGENYTMYLSELPLISIKPEEEIVDEPRTLACFMMTESDGTIIHSNIGVEFRGRFSQTYDKKSLRIEFWNDTTGDDTENYSLLGMRDDDDWNLQAMYNEPMRLRNKSAFDLWRQIDTLYYQEEESKAINGVHYEYVELFVNDEYRGVYGLSERVDRKQLRLKKEDDGEIRGELYKGILKDVGVLFTGAPSFDNLEDTWKGYEYDYPDIIDWTELHKTVSFVVGTDEEMFLESVSSVFDIDNLVNYFIFLNLTRAEDNTGKNIFLAKYDVNEPYFYVPWDLDGIFGMRWDGVRWRITDDILSNGLYDRLLDDTREDGFVALLKQRWTRLRSEVITTENINEIVNANFSYLSYNGIYERERIAWPNTKILNENTGNYTTDWLIERIAFLDQAFDNLDVVSSNIDINNQIDWSIIPNPSFGMVRLQSNREIKQVVVLTQNGIKVKESTAQDVTQIDLQDLPKGMYFIRIVDSAGDIGVKKVVLVN